MGFRPAIMVVLALAIQGDAHAETGERWDPATVALQSLVATGGMVISAGLVANLTGKDECQGYDCYNFSGVFLAGIVGITASVAGTQLAGDGKEGTGTIGGTLLGTGVGLAVGVGSVFLAAKIKNNGYLALAAFALPIIAGGVIGYHLSADETPDGIARIPLLRRSF